MRAKLAADIAALTTRAKAADVETMDPQALPDELARRGTLLARLDAACARLEEDDVKVLYKQRKQSVEPVFGTIKSGTGFPRFHLRGLANVASTWALVALACNCRRINRMLTT